jgi:8-amino-7-oxononanoate synthase
LSLLALAAFMPETVYGRFCDRLAAAGRKRMLRAVGPSEAGCTRVGEKSLVNFSSNNYLGLAQHPELIRRAREWAGEWGAGAGASRLVCGTLELHERVEEKLARGKGTEAALVFNSGYQANASVLPALLDRRVLGAEPLVFSDRLNHASIHAGCRAAGVRQIRYRHNDTSHLEDLLKSRAADKGARFILSETVFSMEGDRAEVGALTELAERFGAFLYLDEAHATGVLGRDGFGLSAEHPGGTDLAMGTFSKALGGFGGYVACSAELRDYLVNRCAGFVYSTALPPAVLGAMDAALDLLPGLERRRRALQDNAERVRGALRGAGLDCGASTTQIIPLILGREEDALTMSRDLEEEGILAVAIRPPTVPAGASRIRFSLTAAHTEGDLARLCEAVPRLGAGRPALRRGAAL